MNEKTAKTIARMIEKECQRYSLGDLCEDRGVTCDDFDLFLQRGIEAFKEGADAE